MASSTDKGSRQQRAEQMRREREKAEKRRRNGITLGIIVVVVILVAVAAFAVVNEVGKSNAPAATPKNTTDDYGIVYDQGDAGGSGAVGGDAVPVVVYEDFQCPVCKAFEEATGQFLDQQVASGAISIEYRPLNILKDKSTDEYSTRAGNTAACVVDTGGAKAFHELQKLLYANQTPEGGPGLTDEQLAGYARQAGGLETAQCIEDGTYEGWIEEASAAAQDDEVGGTPTVLVDGKVVTGQGGGVPDQQTLQQAIAAAAQG